MEDRNKNKAVPSGDAVLSKVAKQTVEGAVDNSLKGVESVTQKIEATGETIKEVIVVYDNDKAIKYTLPEEFNKNHTIGKITWTPTSDSAGGGSAAAPEGTDGGSKQGGKKSRKPKSKRIRVRKTRRRKH